MKERKYPCWSCDHEQTVFQASNNDGFCVKCQAELLSEDNLWPPKETDEK